MTKRTIVSAAALAAPLVGMMLAASPALAAGQSYQADLQPLNNQTGAKGSFMLTLDGNTATITEKTSGLASTFMDGAFPHVQHIHGGAQGQCPGPSADTSGDGVVSVAEGQPSYGGILTTLSVSGDTSPAAATDVKIAPSGASFDYSRSIELSDDAVQSIKDGNAVIVVHGADPAKLSQEGQAAMSELVPSLPLAATSPALCGKLVAAQMSSVPSGGAATGGGSTSGIEDTGVLALGGLSLAGAVGVLAYRRRSSAQV